MNKIVPETNLPELYDPNNQNIGKSTNATGGKVSNETPKAHEWIETFLGLGSTRLREPVPLLLRGRSKVKFKGPLSIDSDELGLLAHTPQDELSSEIANLYTKLSNLDRQQPSEVNAGALDVLEKFILGLEYINVFRYGGGWGEES